MAAPTTPQNQSGQNVSPEAKKNNVENSKKMATHLETAAKHHQDAAKHHQDDNHDLASKSTMQAQEHLTLANTAQQEEEKRNQTIKG